MKLKSKIISSAVVAALGTIAGAAHAVHLGEDGQGQVLVYPYYTTQSGNDTYMTVVNSDAVSGKAVKVRFIEGKASREVLDFNLYLSPNDMWTAAITRDASGNPMVRTWDKSCTAPMLTVNATSGAGEAAFVNFAYSGDPVGDNALSRASEGYIEIIQMGDVLPAAKTLGVDHIAANADDFAFGVAITHSAGVPANCAGVNTAWSNGDFAFAANNGVAVPTGTLSGYGTIINVAAGTDVTYDAVAIDAFSNVANHQLPGSIRPDLRDVAPKISNVAIGANSYNTNWAAGIGAGLTEAVPVSAVILRDQIVNEYAVAAAPVGLGTDWVVTMPTKRLHTIAGLTDPFDPAQTLGKTGWCETVALTTYDREEGIVSTGLQFSPQPTAGVNSLCWEANVVSMSNGGTISNVLGSTQVRQTLPVPFAAGWLRMGFTAATQTIIAATIGANTIVTPLGGIPLAAAALSYDGLPVVGFMAQSYVNTGTVANYGGTSTHRYTRAINP